VRTITVAGRREQRGDVDIAVNVIGPPLQQKDRRTSRAGFGVSTFRTPASICFRAPNDVFVPGLILGRSAALVLLD